MLKADVLTKLKTTFKGIDVDALIAAITATEEKDFEIPEVQVLTTAELTTRDENMKKAGKTEGEGIGETKGQEIAVKKIVKKLGLDPAKVGNDLDKLELEASTKFKAGDKGLQDQIDLLLKDKEALEGKVTAAEGKASASEFDAQLITMFPAKRNDSLSDKQRMLLLKNDLQFETVEGKLQIKKNGVLLTDPGTHAPLPLEKVLTDYFTEMKWTEPAPGGGGSGRGGGNSGGGGGTGLEGIKTFTAYQEKWKAEHPGKNVVSPEFDADLAAHTKDMKDFDFNT